MPGSRASVFGEAEDFQAALSADGVAGLLITGRGHFRARLTQIGLDRLGLAAVEEAVSRIAFVAVPAGMVLVSFPIAGGPSPVWAGIKLNNGEMITLGAGQRVHARTLGPCRWGTIRAPNQQLADYGRLTNGTGFVVPPAVRWRPARAAIRELLSLHRAAIGMAEARAGALTDLQAAYGLEQQLLDALKSSLRSCARPTTTRTWLGRCSPSMAVPREAASLCYGRTAANIPARHSWAAVYPAPGPSPWTATTMPGCHSLPGRQARSRTCAACGPKPAHPA